jgi:hypothetical protein|tara:strand:+ start:23 stop:631 length:609 start_codon:yes stop_codon:yes gene_type:complete
MPFWSTNFSEQGSTYKDPKRKFRFQVQFQGISAQIGGAAAWYAKTVNKPSYTIASAEHKYLNHTFFYPGSVTWQDVTITLVDPVEPDMAATLSDIVQLSGYKPPVTPTDETSLGTMSKAKAAGALGAVTIAQLDGEGAPLETWTLMNAFITEVKYGDLAYGDDELTELSLTLKYDWATVETTTQGSVATQGGGTNFFSVASS